MTGVRRVVITDASPRADSWCHRSVRPESPRLPLSSIWLWPLSRSGCPIACSWTGSQIKGRRDRVFPAGDRHRNHIDTAGSRRVVADSPPGSQIL